jgi:hypothetical protein
MEQKVKRSEMVNIILNVFEKTSSWSDEEVASKVLEKIEEYGMLPPLVGIGEEDQWGYLQYENEWETEDEV